MKLVIISFLLLGVAWAELNCNCGWRSDGINAHGYETRKDEYPWLVAILSKTRDSTPYCSGTIITKWHVITSADCVSVRRATDLILVAGANNLISPGYEWTKQYYSVDKITTQLRYKKGKPYSNLAILTTADEIIYSDFIGPACLPSKNKHESEMIGETLFTIGWRNTKRLNHVFLENIDHASCQEKNIEDIKRLCTLTAYSKSCVQGDSGDPVFWEDEDIGGRYALVGVVSKAASKQCKSREPAISSSVAYHFSWIIDVIRESKKENTFACHHQP